VQNHIINKSLFIQNQGVLYRSLYISIKEYSVIFYSGKQRRMGMEGVKERLSATNVPLRKY